MSMHLCASLCTLRTAWLLAASLLLLKMASYTR
jgi:hypothetical protein